jgi:3-hydroxyacyl-CoA dehydrogenase / enoyl-CoA hydratase / 3-hydroxybutyryl-CoA epimerase
MEVLSLKREQDVARLVLARGDKPVNVLDVACMEQLEAQLSALEKDPPRLLVIESAMPGCFIAGADLDVIATVTDAGEAQRLAERGQALCRRIEDLPSISVVVVNGACMGGGLELALACDHIIAVRGGKTQLALPEIKIGIHPGFGGCVRLPRRVGWIRAVEMIMSGRSVDAERARRMHLATLACHPEQVEAAVQHAADIGKVRRRGVRPGWLRLWPAKRLFFAQARKKVFGRFKHLEVEASYPAVPAALKLLEEIVNLADGQAYAREAESLGRLAVTPTCKSLIRVFHLGQALSKQEAVKRGREAAAAIGHVAIYGAGAMGSGIAWVATRTGDVDLHDVSEEAVARGLKAIAGFARRDTGRMRRIRPALDDSGLARSDVVIEAVLEDMEIKRKLWAQVEKMVRPEALLLTNTSSLSVTEMQKNAVHPERMAGLHFFNPAPKMPLVEVVAGDKTALQTLDTTAALAAAWGKYPVVVADRPGFLVNRCLMPYMVAALSLLEQGQKPQHVDGALKAFGMPMGAMELADRVGLDICRHVGHHLSEAFGDRFTMPAWFGRMVDDALLGEKSGRGFFSYDHGKLTGLNPDLAQYLSGVDISEHESAANIDVETGTPMADYAIVHACLIPMLIEALACLDEGVVAAAEPLDAALVFGIGFPPFRGGLLHYYAGLPKDELGSLIRGQGRELPSNLDAIYG